MSEPKHTPGPWDWEYEDVACTRPIALSAPSGDVLVASEDGAGPRAYVSDVNARLIAAAPDLIAACEKSLSLLMRLYQGDSSAAMSLRAAIAKATGGQS